MKIKYGMQYKEGRFAGLETLKFHRDTWAEINLDHIYDNVASMKKRLPENVKIFAVVKANGYGHGDVQTAKTALEAGADFLAVAFIDEALSLRQKGISSPILVLGAARPESAGIAAENHITLTVFQESWIREAGQYIPCGQTLKLHLKCDSGMGRIGIKTKGELEKVEESLEKDPRFYLEGIYTHFATADEISKSYYQKQLNTFNEMLSWLKKKPELIHASNSAASLRFSDSVYNAVRMGISMYGLSPSPEMKELLPFPLKPALSLKTKVVHVKKLQKGESVSYGATYTAKEDGEWIATLPIGYADGWIRRLQGQEVNVSGEMAPIVGRICMDQCMVKLSRQVPLGTEVILIGESEGLCISADDIAKRLETINYEVTCMLGARIPRVYIRNGKAAEVSNTLWK
jgi:alanine racemase